MGNREPVAMHVVRKTACSKDDQPRVSTHFRAHRRENSSASASLTKYPSE
jgi:hypothetical protein